MRGDGEAEPDEHPARVGLDRRLDEVAELGERDDVRGHRLDLRAVEPVERADHQDVLPAREVAAEARAELE